MKKPEANWPEENWLVCDQCHMAKPDVMTILDPYSLDVNNEEVEMDLCEDCASERAADV